MPNLTLDETYSILTQTADSITAEFLERLPYLVVGVFILLLTWFCSNIGKFFFKHLFKKNHLHKSLIILFKQLTSVFIWVIGIAVSLVIIFPELTPTKLLGGLGVFTLAIGFAFKDTFENFFAGVLLLWRFPFDIGDFIEYDGKCGKVEDITIRMTMLRTFQGELLIVPNSDLFNNYLHVLTDKSHRRISINAEVAYSENLQEACQLIKNALQYCKTVDQNQPVYVLANCFAASGISIEVIWWAMAEPLSVKQSISEVIINVKETLDNANIEIPFPYRTLVYKNSNVDT